MTPLTGTAAAIWLDVARQLRERRKALGWSTQKVERNGGPTYKTVQATEAGDLARIDLLERHAVALGLNLRDVLRAACGMPEPFSVDARFVARVYDRTTSEGKDALKGMARALDRVKRWPSV